MRYLFSHWDSVSRKLKGAPHRLYLFDFDGTLAPLSPIPWKVQVPSRVQKMLKQLESTPGCSLGIISGRWIKDLRHWIRLRKVFYSGNHGHEWRTNGSTHVHPGAYQRKGLIRQLSDSLRRHLSFIPGVYVENKGLSLSVHIRHVRAKKKRLLARDYTRALVETRLYRESFNALEGKLAIEIIPRTGWDKGAMTAACIEQAPNGTCVLYVGDDLSDEPAFRAVGRRGLAVRIGAREGSRASYYLKNQQEVPELLERLVAL